MTTPTEPNNQPVTIQLPHWLAQKMIGPWYLIKKPESDLVRNAMRQATNQ